MAELTDLLRDAVERGDVPPPALDRIRGEGARIVRRRRARTAVAGLAAAVVAVAAVSLTVGGDPGADRDRVADRDRGTRAQVAYEDLGSYAIAGSDSAVHVGNAVWRSDETVAALDDTGIGTLVTLLPRGDEAPRFLLVRPDGRTRPLVLPAGTRSVVGDRGSSRVVLLGVDGDTGLSVRVWDLEESRELFSTVRSFRGADADAAVQTAAFLDGDLLAVQDPDGDPTAPGRWALWDWRRGGAPSERQGQVAGLAGGRLLSRTPGASWRVTPADGDAVLRDLGTGDRLLLLSPDGRWVLQGSIQVGGGEETGLESVGAQFISVDEGDRFTLDSIGEIAGWTPGSRLIGAEPGQGRITRCRPEGSTCVAQDLDLADPEDSLLKIGRGVFTP